MLPSGEDTGWEREGKRRTAGLERDNRRKRERGSIESPLQRVSAGVARWNHAAARGLFSVYICRSITLDPVGCRPLSRRVRCSGAQPAARGMNLVRPFLSLSLFLPSSLSLSLSLSLSASASAAQHFGLAKIYGEFAPSTRCHFSSGVARLDKC